MSNSGFGRRRPALIACLFVVGALFLVLPSLRPAEVPVFFLFLGRLHPLVLHFPIVLIILALLFEIAGRFYKLKVGENTVLIVLAVAALSSLISVVAGYFLFASGDYSGDLMEGHFWFGAITGAAVFFTLALLILYRTTNRYYYFYFGLLVLTNATVGYTSHLGGSITHGRDYLTEHLQYMFHSVDDDVREESQMRVFDDMLLPVFEAKCMSCHNTQRAKGDFVMSSYANLLKGGSSGALAVSPGKALESEVFKRVVLPNDHPDKMPPEGKSPMSPAEIAILKHWLDAGASDSLRVVAARGVDSMQAIVNSMLPELAKYRRRAIIEKAKLKEIEAELTTVAEKLDVTIKPDSLSDENLFLVAMKFPPAPFTNDQFRELHPYFNVFSKLSLASSGIDDAGLYYISQMTNVRELYLQKTKIEGSGIIYLRNLPNLEVLNLSFTKVDDRAALDLLEIPRLRVVYLYRTNTSMQVIEALRKYRPSVRFLLEEGPYY